MFDPLGRNSHQEGNIFNLEELEYELINEDLHIKLNGDENEETMFVIKKILFPLHFPRSMAMDKNNPSATKEKNGKT
jgi:hypothetical protein